jgi:hypothetical protein
MCPCGDIGLDLSMLVRPEVRPLFWTVVVMVGMFFMFLLARGERRSVKKHREPQIADIVHSIAEDNARLRKELERTKPRWRF